LFVVLALIAATACVAPGLAFAQEARVEVAEAALDHQRNVSLTVYSSGLALVREERVVSLAKGLNLLCFPDVPKELDSSSVRLRSLTAPGDLNVIEQSFEYDLASRVGLLEKYVGKEIGLNRDGVVRPARLLAVDPQGRLTVEMDGKILLDPLGEVELPSLPSGLFLRPTLSWLVDAKSDGSHVIGVTYLAEGLGWRANYACVLDPAEKHVALDGWVTLDNESGATFRNASLRLVAGGVRAAEPEAAFKATAGLLATTLAVDAFREQPLFEYHSYELGRRTTVQDNQSKQIELLSASNVPVKKLYVFESPRRSPEYEKYAGQKETGDVKVIVQFQNKTDARLGIPLPAGQVRVYKASADGSLAFVGEDKIAHTPRDETVELYVGNAFDIVGERLVTDYKKTGPSSYEEACCIRLRNHKDEDVEITVIERFYGEWAILSCVPTSYQKLDANTAAFKIKVPKGKEGEILYRVRVIAD
jgi:hypothetical protein